MRSIVAATVLCAALGGVVLPALQEGPPPAATAPAAPPPPLPLVTAQDLLDGLKHPGRWLTYSGDYTGRRHSPLKQIAPDNVARLSAQWTFQAEGMVIGRGFEGTPLVMDGVLYITGNNNTAWALDARTGRQLWRYRRQLPPGLTYGAGNPSNRGFAALGDRLYMATLDAHLLAFDRNTGKIVWDVVMDDYKLGHAGISAPLVVKDKVIIGNSGGDIPTRGFLDAYDAATGQRAWRFYTIPGKGEPGSETWSSEDVLPRGGGAAWVTGSYDPELNLLYWGTGNPNPDYYGGDRLGDNLYTASIVAIDADTGKLRWHYQFTPHDLHDWDSNHVPVLADLTIGGRPRKVVMMANRNGFFYTLDRTTGELLVARPYINTAWAKEIGKDGKPVVLNDGVIPPGGSESTTPCVPDFRGGTVFNPPSYDPALQQFYVMARETCAYYTPQKHGGAAAGRGLHERRHAQAGGAGFRRAARHRPADRRTQVGIPVRAVVARRGDVHGLGAGVRGQPGRRVRGVRRQDRQTALDVPNGLADLGGRGQHLHAGRQAVRPDRVRQHVGGLRPARALRWPA